MSPVRWESLTAALSQRLRGHRFTGEGANRLPDPHHYVTTIYFDTPSRTLLRAAATAPDHNLKVRAKEYYDLHPSLAELATDPEQIVHYQPWLWFELKRREGTRTSKRRFRLPKRDVTQFFAEGRVTADAFDLAEAAEGESLRDVDPDLHRARRAAVGCLPRQLSPALLAVGRRGAARDVRSQAWRRIAPPANLWARRQALVRSALGVPAAQEASGVLEIKRRGAVPAWLADCVERIGATPVPFSKFVTAARAVEAHA